MQLNYHNIIEPALAHDDSVVQTLMQPRTISELLELLLMFQCLDQPVRHVIEVAQLLVWISSFNKSHFFSELVLHIVVFSKFLNDVGLFEVHHADVFQFVLDFDLANVFFVVGSEIILSVVDFL